MSLIVDHEDSLVHENLKISAHKLTPNAIFTIELRLLHSVGTYKSWAVFKSNSSGEICLYNEKPIRGTYSGVRPMGLFESIEPTENVRFGGYCKCTPPDNFNYVINLKNCQEKIICSKKIIKRLLHPLVSRIEVDHCINENNKQRKVVGTLFKPPGIGPYPTIIDVSGTGGGINEQKGAALASRGFCALSLAFFQYKDLPENIQEVDLQYFKDAVDFVTSLPYTTKRIGLQGVSFGGTLVIYLTTKIPQIKAVVSINGSLIFDELAWIKDGENPVNHAKVPSGGSEIYFINGMMCYDKIVKALEIPHDAHFQFHNSANDCAFRFVASMDDLSMPTIYAVNHLTAKLKKLKRIVNVQMLPGGHLMDPPCYPSHPIVFAKIAGVLQAYGGETSLHGSSEFIAWENTVEFFSKYVGSPNPLPKIGEKSFHSKI